MSKNFKPMRMTWAAALRMVRLEFGTATAKDLFNFANANPDLFPKGISMEDAEWIVAHPNAFTDGEP